MMEVLDTDVGRILAILEELGVDENTMILFLSDNGTHIEGGHDSNFWNSNGPFRGHKRDLYEGGIHTPALVRWPAVISPSTSSDHISAFWDILPTMAEITEQANPSQVDGISFLPTLKGNNDDQDKHDYLFFEFWQGRKPKLVSQAVRFGDWKALRSAKFLNENQENIPLTEWPVELYNLSEDIGEQNNIAMKYPELVEKAKNIMQVARVDLTN
jgi:arylsulfatase A-like enzyme